MPTGSLGGGCLCGAVRYRVRLPPIDAGYCHCRLCQRSSGAPALAWLTVATGAFAYTRGRCAVFRSSEHSQREFCGACGTPIAFRRVAHPTTVDVTLASLDDPNRVRPEYHIWRMSRIDWFETEDTLPRHADAGPDAALTYRSATSADAPLIVSFVNAAYRGDSSRAGWTTEADLLGGQRTDEQEIVELIQRPHSVILLALRGTDVVGVVHLERRGERASLGLFAIRPGEQGRGLGSEVMREAEQRVRSWWAVRAIELSVITLRDELIAYYERRGYERTGTREPFPSSTRFGIPRVPLEFEVLVKRLDPR